MTPATAARLDWACIGAQKAGTSTLFRLLRSHPQIRIPKAKEDPIFDREVAPSEVEAYLDDRFGDADLELRRGTVTPQYMSSPDTAARLHRFAPEARIVVLVRDPVGRAFSQYRMAVRRGLETRPFAEAARAQLAELVGGGVPDPESETRTYVFRGCYGRILDPWYELFGSGGVHVELTDDLDERPDEVVAAIEAFLGVPHLVTDTALRAHADPPPHRLSGLRRPVADALRRVGVLQRVPVERKEQLAEAIERTLARLAPAERPRVDPEVDGELRRFYADDRARLEARLERPLPWAR